MRQFAVIAYATTQKDEAGEIVYLGSDRGEAIGVTETPENGCVRKALFELSAPQQQRYFGNSPNPDAARHRESLQTTLDAPLGSTSLEPASSLPGSTETAMPSEGAGEQLTTDAAGDAPAMSPAAQELVDKHELNPQQIAQIVPSGASGQIVKGDVEAFITLSTGAE